MLRVGIFGVSVLLAASALAYGARAVSERVRILTSSGSFTVEMDREHAPQAVARFLARAGLEAVPAGLVEVAPYRGLTLCESRAHGFLVFGCLPYDPSAGQVPRAPGKEPPVDEEIDATAMGLARRKIASVAQRDWLWQREIFPRTWKLEEDGRPIPPGLRELTAAVKKEGTSAMSRLDGMSWRSYLEAVGYRFTRGGAARRMVRGALAAANFWPGEADERFLLALADLPERDGRATVYGRIVEGWETIDAIAAIPVDKGHRPRRPVTILGMEIVR